MADTGFAMVNYNDYEGVALRQYYNPSDPRLGASQGFRSKERQESAMACNSTTGTPEESPCST